MISCATDCGWIARVLGEGRTGKTNMVAVDRVQFGQAAGQLDDIGVLPELWHVTAETIFKKTVERVILTPDGRDEQEVLGLIRLIKALGLDRSVVPRLLEVVGPASTFDKLGGLSLLGVRRYGLTKSSTHLKRATAFVAALGFLVLFAPLLGVVALAIRLDSCGPVFLRQPRIGRGPTVHIIKFRSMVRDAEAIKPTLRALNEVDGGLFKVADDPRITRVGRVLWKTSLDELPQLLNVLRGEMGLVGPRRLVPDEDALIEGWQRRRLTVRPGMTRVWQIFGSSKKPMHERDGQARLHVRRQPVAVAGPENPVRSPYSLGRQGL